jgi:hypothetical protein
MANAHALDGLTKWLRRQEWRDGFNDLMDLHVGPACAKAGVSVEEMPDLVGRHGSVLWAWVFEDFLARDLDDGRNIVDDYLKRRGWKEGATNKAYMTALRSSVMSLYEVSDVVRNESFLARDLVRGGEPIRISERSGTRYLKPWDRMGARIVQVGSRMQMAGGVLLFDREAADTLLDVLQRAGKKARAQAVKYSRVPGSSGAGVPPVEALSDTAILRSSAFLFTNVWLNNLLQGILHPSLPHMVNAGGDELVFTTLRYPLAPAATVGAVGLALAAKPALRRESETFWNWIDPQKCAAPKPTSGHAFVTTLEDGSLVLGTLELKDNLLVLEVNSQRRAERGRALVEPVLGALVGEPVIEARTVEQLMASRPAGKPKTLSSGLPPHEERAIVHASLDLHYGNLLEVPVPMLGNITPIEATKTPNGREKLVAWLKYTENGLAKNESASPLASYDVGWLWNKLGIADLRR